MPEVDVDAIRAATEQLVSVLQAERAKQAEHRDGLRKELAAADDAIRSIDVQLSALMGAPKKRTRTLGRPDQILGVINGAGEPLTGEQILAVLAPEEGEERSRYGLALKKMQSTRQLNYDQTSKRYSVPGA